MPTNPSTVPYVFAFQFNSRDAKKKRAESEEANANEARSEGVLPVE
jgi:hypothetical protein